MTLSGWTWVDWLLYALTLLVVFETRDVTRDLIARWYRERERLLDHDPLVESWARLRRELGPIGVQRESHGPGSGVPTEKDLRDISPGRVLRVPVKELKNVRRRPKRPGHRNAGSTHGGPITH